MPSDMSGQNYVEVIEKHLNRITGQYHWLGVGIGSLVGFGLGNMVGSG